MKEDSSHTFCQFERGDFEIKFNGQTQVHKLTKLSGSSILQQGYKLFLCSNDDVLFIQKIISNSVHLPKLLCTVLS